MSLTTVADMKAALLANLDDLNQTSFTDSKVLALLNSALKYVVDQATSHSIFHRRLIETVIVVSGTASYVMLPEFRHPILIERTDDDGRTQGTIIQFAQRNLATNPRWKLPIVYFEYLENLTVGDFRAHMVFAKRDQPTEGQVIDVHYAPKFIKFVNDSSEQKEVHSDYEELIIMKATIQGFGGEKNADPFWMAQFQDIFQQTLQNWENEGQDQVEVIDGYYQY